MFLFVDGLPLTEETGLFDAEVGVNLLDLHGASPEAMVTQ